MNPPTLTTKRRIKRIAPLQLAKMLAVLYGLMGVIFMPFFLLMTLVASQMPASQRVGLLALGAGFAIFVPIIYAAMGFVFGALGALIYNVVHNWAIGVATLVLAWWLVSPAIALFGAVLVAHVGMDRAAGYGLKYPTAFADTHLGRLGRRSR